jgi:hypothetical protein
MKEQVNIPVSAGSLASTQAALAEVALHGMSQKNDSRLLYHRYFLAARTAQIVLKLAELSEASPQDTLVASSAAWLHLLGFSHNYDQPYQIGRQLAQQHLQKMDLDPQFIQRIDHCLEIVQQRKEPNDTASRLFLDAYHGARFGKEYPEEAPLLRLEADFMGKPALSDAAWDPITITGIVAGTVLHCCREKGI